MADPPTLQDVLIVWHSRTGASELMARAAARSAGIRLIAASAVEPAHLLGAAGYVFVCPENLGSMSGAMKDMFDRTYYPALGQIEGRPYATIIAAGSDGHGALAQIDRIATGWRLKRVAESIIVNFAAQTPEAILAPKKVPDNVLKQCAELGQTLAQGIAIGVF